MISNEGNGQATSTVKRASSHEGPKNHFLAFAISIALTVLAFMVVYYQSEMEPWFVYGILVLMAIVQAAIQGFFWMHLKDPGHIPQRIFMMGGIVVAFTAIVMAIYWVWW